MPSVFDGMADEFIRAFGEDVVYTPAGGSPVTIKAIWIEAPVMAPFSDADTVSIESRLSVQAADPLLTRAPAEGDTAQRVKDGKTRKLVEPIEPDDKGMIRCALAVP